MYCTSYFQDSGGASATTSISRNSRDFATTNTTTTTTTTSGSFGDSLPFNNGPTENNGGGLRQQQRFKSTLKRKRRRAATAKPSLSSSTPSANVSNEDTSSSPHPTVIVSEAPTSDKEIKGDVESSEIVAEENVVLDETRSPRQRTSSEEEKKKKGKLKRMFTRRKKDQRKQKAATVEFRLVEDMRLVTIPVSSCLLVLAFYIFVGTVLFSHWEGWSYLDGAYFCFISLMTIGFGDFVPGRDYIYHTSVADENSAAAVEANAKLILGTIYILLGMAIVAMCFNLMQEKIVAEIRAAARRVGLIRPARY